MPGYGYASVSKEVKAKWGKLIERYLRNSKQLQCVFLLVDIRHAPSTNDVEMYEWNLGKWVLSDYYCNKAGQNKKKPFRKM